MITVVNRRTYTGKGIYIGRPSVLGNIFRIGVDGTREEVILKYQDYLLAKLRSHRDSKTLDEIRRIADLEIEQGNVTLICHCAPERCHGDVIKLVVGFYNLGRKTLQGKCK